MIKKIILFLFAGTIQLCYAQTVTIISSSNLQPVENATIAADQSLTMSDAKGRFDISLIKNSPAIIISAIGFETLNTNYKLIEESNFKVILNPRTVYLGEAVISSSRFEEKKIDVSRQIETITKKEIQSLNAQSTADVMERSGQVFVQKSQMGGGSPVLRGFEANKILMVIDGVRMNNAIYRGGHLQNIITIDNSMLDRVEVLFGPGSVMYGSDALGGVINFITQKPRLSFSEKTNVGVNASTRYSTAFNEFTGHVNVNLGFKKFASLTSFTTSSFGDLRQGNDRNPFYGDWGKRKFYQGRIDNVDTMLVNDNVNIQKGTAYKQYDLMQKFLFRQSDNFSHMLSVQYSTSSDIPRYDRLTEVNSSGIFRNAEWYYGPQERFMTSYQLSINNNGKIFNKANLTLAYQDIEESRHNRSWKSANLNHRVENVKVYTFNADFEKRSGKHELQYGIDAAYNEVGSKAESENINTGIMKPLDTRYPDGGSKVTSAAFFAQHRFHLTEKFITTAGIRFTKYQLSSKFIDKTFFPFPFDDIDQSSQAFNGNIGFTFIPNQSWKIAVNGATGFRAPNVDDLAKVFESTSGKLIVPNPDLKPEYTYTGEFTIEKTIEKNTKIYTTAWYTNYKDALTTEASKLNGVDSIDYNGSTSAVFTTVNKNEAYLYGFTLGIKADATRSFSIASQVTYTYGRISVDNSRDYPLDHIAPVYGKTTFIFTKKKFQGLLNILFNGPKNPADYNLLGEDNQQYSANPTSGYTPAWYTLNASVKYTIIKNFSLQTGLDNILDRNYRTFASGISAPGRNLSITLIGNF